MINKSLILVVSFTLFLGVNKAMSQDDPCNLVEQIGSAVEAVMLTSDCDGSGWVAPRGLEVRLVQLDRWCTVNNIFTESKIAFIVDKMSDIVTCAIEGSLDGLRQPAPDCALEELIALEDVLSSAQADD